MKKDKAKLKAMVKLPNPMDKTGIVASKAGERLERLMQALPDFLKLKTLTNKLKTLTYDEWLTTNEAELNCKFAVEETVEDRQMDFSLERYLDKEYEAYLKEQE